MTKSTRFYAKNAFTEFLCPGKCKNHKGKDTTHLRETAQRTQTLPKMSRWKFWKRQRRKASFDWEKSGKTFVIRNMTSSNKSKIKITTSYLPTDTNQPARKVPNVHCIVKQNHLLSFQRDVQLECKIANWLATEVQEAPKVDFDEWIKDGRIICRVFNQLVFNSVPIDITQSLPRDVEVSDPVRVQTLINHLKDFGMDQEDLFHPKDLTEKRHIPRVCRCLEQFRKLVRNFIDCGNVYTYILLWEKYFSRSINKVKMRMEITTMIEI